MRVPEWAVEELAKIYKPARLGFWKRRENSDGAFFLLELRPARRAEAEYYEFWNNRGPIFGANFDRVTQVPVMVYEFSIEDVMYGRFIPKVRRMLTSVRQRIKEKHEANNKQYREGIEELAGQIGSEMFWKAKRDCDGASHIPSKDLTPQEKDLLTGDWRANIRETPAPQPSPMSL
jgi:hypothetical protein